MDETAPAADSPQHGTYTVACVSVDITPSGPIELVGRTERSGVSAGIAEPLEANCLWLRSAGDSTDPGFLIVAIDALYGGFLGSCLASELGVPGQSVLVLGSHTHSAPGTDTGLSGLGITRPDHVRSVAAAVARDLRAAAPHEVSAVVPDRVALSPLFVNRRHPVWGGLHLPHLGSVVAAPNPAGPVDLTATVLTLIGTAGPIAVIWGVACHPVCAPHPDLVSPDYPGRVRAGIRAAAGWAIPVVFAQGFSADIRPATSTRRPTARPKEMLKYLLAGARRFADQSVEVYDSWCATLTEQVTSAWPPDPVRGEAVDVTVHRADLPDLAWERSPTATVVTLGKNCALLAVNAEVPVERVGGAAQALGLDYVVASGCADEVIGYWPTDRMRVEGGYEGATSCAFFPDLDWDQAGGADALWTRLLATVAGQRAGATRVWGGGTDERDLA